MAAACCAGTPSALATAATLDFPGDGAGATGGRGGADTALAYGDAAAPAALAPDARDCGWAGPRSVVTATPLSRSGSEPTTRPRIDSTLLAACASGPFAGPAPFLRVAGGAAR